MDKRSFPSRIFLAIFLFFSVAAQSEEAALPTDKIYLQFAHNNDITGNDFGYTGSVHGEVGMLRPNGWKYSLQFNSDLYSERVIPYGDVNNPSYQPFTGYQNNPKNTIALPKGTQDQRIEQNSTASARAEYHPANQVFSMSVEAGFTQTEGNAAYLPGTSGWQTLLHSLLSATKYNLISDGTGPRYGVFLKPTVAAQGKIFTQSPVSVTFMSDLSGSIDTEGRRTFLESSAGFQLGGFANASLAGELLQLQSIVQTQLSSTHKQVTWQELINVNLRSTTIFGGVTYLFTNTGYADFYETNYVDQDPIYRIGVVIWL
jgi:hypothetical protein